MKVLMTATLVLALAGCATPDSRKEAASALPAPPAHDPKRLAEASFEDRPGGLTLAFDERGNWVRLTATGEATMADETPGAREVALTIATVRAKRAVAEFLRSEVRSSKTLNRVARSYARAYQASDSKGSMGSYEFADDETTSPPTDTEASRQARRVAATLSERIQENSSAILKGVHVSRRSFGDGQVTVEVAASRESVGAAHEVSRMMRGVME